jgi:uncharacterized 2Fe-2S/4Fe-4S cluster protein (DUF4445 family)
MKKPKRRKQKKKRRSLTPPLSRKQKTKYVWLNVLPDDLWLKVRRGKTVWEALLKEDVELESDCGGLGKCGKCKIKVISSIGKPTKEERELLDEEELRQGIRLACRTKIKKDLVIYTEETDYEMEYFQILKSGQRPLITIDPLVHCQTVSVSPYSQQDGISSMARIKLAMGTQYQDLKASLYCLRHLPGPIEDTKFQGAAVLHDNFLLDFRTGEKGDCCYGLVFDLGTSTLVGKLISLPDGEEVAVVSCLNGQFKYGTNLISRLQYIKEHPDGLMTLHHLLIRDLNRITRRLLEASGLEPNDVLVAVAAGNTTMQHILLNLNPLNIAEAPFAPVVTDGLMVKAAEVSLMVHPEAFFYIMPAKTGYIGGDLIGTILASGAFEQENEIILGLDLGTNGEIFLGNSKRMMTCSAAAGPAFEGSNISYGMIAKTGAIEGFRIDDGLLHYHIIGNIKPKGICGSGLVDLVAVLLHCGVVDPEGVIQRTHQEPEPSLNERVIDNGGVCDFLIASEEESYDQQPIYLTQKDVRELQLAKGAVGAGIRTLMEEMGIGVQDISRVYLAGALGNYVNPFSAIRIGLIPMVSEEIVTSLGNAATTGAAMVLLSKEYWNIANELVEFIEHAELSSRLDFNHYFIEHMDFPRENVW